MQNKQYKNFINNKLLKLSLLLVLIVSPFITRAATTVLQDCFPAPGNYTINTNAELPSNQNKDGNSGSLAEHFVAEGSSIVADCACPKGNFYSNTDVYEVSAAGSPLPAGVSGYGYLTDHLDINVTAYADAINSPDGSGLQAIYINTYPTPFSSMASIRETKRTIKESTSDVCNDATRPTDGSNTKREFKWNVVVLKYYIKKAILGEEIIPPTIIAQNYACLSFGGSCSVADTKLVSNIQLMGKITAPLTCTINEGSTIEVELGNIVTSQFVTQGEPPANYTLKDVDISYHCDDPAAGNSGKIKFSLNADQGVVPGSNSMIARMLDRDDIGVRMFDDNDNNVVLDGSLDMPVTLDEQGNGKIVMKAAPVSTKSQRPQPGKFEGNVTVKMELR